MIFTFDNFKIGRQLTANIFDPLTDLIEHNSQYGGGPRQAYSRYRETAAKQSTPWMVPGQKPSR